MRLVFMGTPEMAVPTLQRLVAEGHEIVAVITQPDRPAGRGKQLQQPPIKRLAQDLQLPCYQPTKIKTDEFRTWFSSLAADAAVVVAYGRILPAPLLSVPRLGFINNHFSLLPKYRGAAPVNWAIARGEQETGVTTMLIDVGLDTGDILLQQATPIGPDETAVELGHRLAQLGAQLMAETLVELAAGRLTPRPQNHAEATHAPMLHREDGVIDWAWPATAIANRVRGFQPFPTAWTLFNNVRLIIWQATPLPPAATAQQPGQILEIRKDALVVAAGDATSLLVREVQLEGKKRLGVRDFLNGVKLQLGTQLG